MIFGCRFRLGDAYRKSGGRGGCGPECGAHRVGRQKNGKSTPPITATNKGRIKTSRKTMIYGLSLMRSPSVHPSPPSPPSFPLLLLPFSLLCGRITRERKRGDDRLIKMENAIVSDSVLRKELLSKIFSLSRSISPHREAQRGGKKRWKNVWKRFVSPAEY